MANRDVRAELERWIANVSDEELAAELAEMKKAVDAGDDSAAVDAFFQDLAFGTAGLRGTLGAGTNRMNIYTVGRATQGFADYLNANFRETKRCGLHVIRAIKGRAVRTGDGLYLGC